MSGVEGLMFPEDRANFDDLPDQALVLKIGELVDDQLMSSRRVQALQATPVENQDDLEERSIRLQMAQSNLSMVSAFLGKAEQSARRRWLANQELRLVAEEAAEDAIEATREKPVKPKRVKAKK